MVFTYYIPFFRTGTDRHNGIDKKTKTRPRDKNFLLTIRKQLYFEVKQHLKDLITNNWITSYTLYASPMVKARKETVPWGYALTIENWKKDTSRSNSLPARILENTVENLCTQKFFSKMDMSKVYHHYSWTRTLDICSPSHRHGDSMSA